LLVISGPAASFLEEIAARFRVLPLNPIVAADAVTLPLPHGDPFDRVIVATARRHSLPLLSKDRAIATSRLVPLIW
jgi:PIN domain nuclease of toxin-antitoxin system